MIQILKKIFRYYFPLSNEEMFRRMGVKMGENCKIQNEVIIDHSHYWHITIGNNVVLAPRVHILAHDASTKLHFGYTKIANVKICDNVFIGASSIILPGVTIGENSIIGCGSIVTKDVPANVVYAGNPAKFICSFSDYKEKQKKIFDASPKFNGDYNSDRSISKEQKQEMIDLIGNSYGFVE